MTLETERLTLRPHKESDLEDVHSYSSEARVCEFIEWGPNSLAETREFLRRTLRFAKEHPRVSYDFAIFSRQNNRVIGNIGLFIGDHAFQQATLGYVLGSEYWGKGFATEAAQKLIVYGFIDLKLHRISASCDVRNTSSFRVMEKCEMRREALFIQDKFVKGAWRDTLIYSILSSEWHQKRFGG
jgi:RimJ/RimL family protein N-acetyltransferase